MKPVFGIIGCGNIARFHFSALEKAGAQVAHVCDIDPAAVGRASERFRCHSSRDYRDLLADPRVTAVSVLAPRSHREICRAALAAGKDVICEKTMTNGTEEAEDVARAAAASGRLFFTAYMKRFFPAVKKAKGLLPRIGRIFSAQVRSYQQWGNFFETDDVGDFHRVVESYGGAIVKCAASHVIDLTVYLLGRPTELYAHIDFVGTSDFDRKAVAVFHYPRGATATVEAVAHPLKRIGFERNSWDESLEIQGTTGRISLFTPRWDAPENNAALLVHYDDAAETSTEFRFPAINPFDEEISYFASCLERREQGMPDAVAGFTVDALIETMSLSARKKAVVPVDYRGL
jgi:predicted dehydrogenase